MVKLMPKHVQHDQADLDAALEHVIYEMWKYKESVAYYEPTLRVGGDAAIEFRVLHHRVLLDFFYGVAKHQDNILACEYIPGWRQTHDPKSQPRLSSYMTRCHTLLAHISKSREAIAKAGGKSWSKHWPVVEPHLDAVINDFLCGLTVSDKKICSDWITRWSTGSYPGNDPLNAIAAALV